MNAAIRAVVRTAINKGMKVKGIMHGYAGLLQEAAVDADLTELVLDQNDLLAGKGLLDEFFDQSGLAGAQEAGKNINFGHSLNASFFVSRQSRRALARKILHLYYSKPVNGKPAFFKKKL